MITKIYAYLYEGGFEIEFADLMARMEETNWVKFTHEQWAEQGEALFNFVLRRLPKGTYDELIKRIVEYEGEKPDRRGYG